MELRHLRYFEAIAGEEHFSRAAQRLHVAQPALSQRMRDLEADLGFALFERRGRGVRLTRAGRYYLEEVRQVLARLDAARVQAGQLARGEMGSLRLAILETLSLAGPVPRLLQELRGRHPGLHLKLVGMPSLAQYEALQARRIDAGFTAHRSIEAPDIQSLPISAIPIVALVPARHPLAGRPSLELKDLEGLDFIWPEADASTSYWGLFQEALEGIPWRPRVVQEASSWVATVGLVAAGYGCALGLSMPGGTPGAQGIAQVPIRDLDLRFRVDLVWHKDNPSPALDRFLELAREVFAGPA